MTKRRGVTQYTMSMVKVGHFDSIREAQKAYHITHVSSVCKRLRLSDGGYIWRYDDDEEPMDLTPDPELVDYSERRRKVRQEVLKDMKKRAKEEG